MASSRHEHPTARTDERSAILSRARRLHALVQEGDLTAGYPACGIVAAARRPPSTAPDAPLALRQVRQNVYVAPRTTCVAAEDGTLMPRVREIVEEGLGVALFLALVTAAPAAAQTVGRSAAR